MLTMQLYSGHNLLKALLSSMNLPPAGADYLEPRQQPFRFALGDQLSFVESQDGALLHSAECAVASPYAAPINLLKMALKLEVSGEA